MNTRELAQILLNIPSVGEARTKNIINSYKGNSLSLHIAELYPFLNIDEKTVEKARHRASRQISSALRSGITLHSWKDRLYPRKLLSISDFPPLLYTKGRDSVLNRPLGAAIIGSRRATGKILDFTELISEMLVYRGYTIISGMALGCDAVAHKTALKRGGTTIAVMPCGPDYIYPRENLFLYHQMISGEGLVLSEYGPSVPPAPFRFVRRDRLQSGLSRFVVLMESPVRGGSMHTAEFAFKQGRPVFVYAPQSYNQQNLGNLSLIERGQGIPFRTPEELLELVSQISCCSGDCQRKRDQILFSYE